MPDDDYRDMLNQIAGVRSAAKLDNDGLDAVIRNLLKRLVWIAQINLRGSFAQTELRCLSSHASSSVTLKSAERMLMVNLSRLLELGSVWQRDILEEFLSKNSSQLSGDILPL